jgi:hypothetical protein
MGYHADREFADTYLKQQQMVLAQVLETYYPRLHYSAHNDLQHMGDLTVMACQVPELPNIGLRLRRPFYAARFGLLQFTIRSYREIGVETELAKIESGKGGWFAYFHLSE